MSIHTYGGTNIYVPAANAVPIAYNMYHIHNIPTAYNMYHIYYIHT